MKKFTLLAATLFMYAAMFAAELSIAGVDVPEAYTTKSFTVDNIEFGCADIMQNQKNTPTDAAKADFIQIKKNTGELYNKTALNNISTIVVSLYQEGSFQLFAGNSEKPAEEITPVVSDAEYTFDLSSKKPAYFYLKNGSKVLYVESIEVTYEGGEVTPPDPIFVEALGLDDSRVAVGKTVKLQVKYFDAAGAPANAGMDGLEFEWSSSDEAIATVKDGVVTGVKAGQTTIAVNVKKESSPTHVIQGAECTVTVYENEGGEQPEPQTSDFAKVGTSNILPVDGNKAEACKVNDFDGVKCGTGSEAGTWEITVPAGTERLHLHAAAWKDKACKLSVEGGPANLTLQLKADDGFTQNSPFTLVGNIEDYYFVIDLTAAKTSQLKTAGVASATKLTFSIEDANVTKKVTRFIVWGVNAEGEGINPDDLNNGGDDDGNDDGDDDGNDDMEADFSLEPTTKGNFNETYDYADYTDNTIVEDPAEETPYVELYFENEGTVLTLDFITNSITNGTIIPAGTYPIDNSGKANTFTASIGAIDFMGMAFPMPCYFANNFQGTSEEDMTYDMYFIVSGTVKVEAVEGGAKYTIDAKSHNGSTIKATYSGEVIEYQEEEEEDALEEVVVPLDKTAPMYNVLGVQVGPNYHGVVIQNGHKYLLK